MMDEAPPVRTIERDGKNFEQITEGKATILVPHEAKIGKDTTGEQQVFYNPIQQYNRDLSTLAVKVYGEMLLEKRIEAFHSKSAKQGKKRKRDELERERDDEQAALQASELHHQPGKEEAENGHIYKPSFKILDALSASGLRALRYALEIPFVTSVTANDLSASAADSIAVNADHNGVADRLTVTNEDALALMYRYIALDLSRRDKRGNPSKSHKFDVVDLDPYGTAAPFFDAAIQSVRDDGGLLVVTCTDSAVWAGHSYCEKAFSLYGGVPVKGMHSHEAALRLILNAVATSGARYGIAIEPILSLSIDFYTKVFIRVTRSPSAVKFLGAKTMLVYSCDQGCGSWKTQPILKSRPFPNKKGNGSFYKHTMAQGPSTDHLCQHCGFKMHVSGPMYGGRIHNQDFIHRMLDELPKASPEVYGTLSRLEGMLRTALEECIPGPELPADVDAKDAEAAVVDPTPFFFIPGKVSSILSCSTPTDDMFRGALMHLGYQVGRSHCRPGSIKTDAPWSTIWWVLTEWIRQKSPIKVSKFKESMAGWKILYDAGIVGHEEDKTSGDDARPSSSDTKSGGTEQQQPPEQQPQEQKDEKVLEGKEMEENNVEKKELPSEEELRKTLVFDDALIQLGRQRGTRYMRYQVNPHKYWGPMTRAKG
ncbi:N2,N2-dimethylguanosine tRNA methyltransferase [Metarhizium album ARSEF 1941]|uniref:tRNA (guanine(26)-N(2))-dimethyltransferase n=1 Tax=Metarhizium album (strain ARSEF 1941) TaxID=1081103 RepID=A0A0B2WXA5_METAS|nr:N2,N2-dimethylguanosine tRNA methyltransferase [Metarhizium album ARSEF 1941]KHN98057.1 N2,N2-dimethylguanosine tRNA methyltransferase [Metarhizium album ARSEF 1941]